MTDGQVMFANTIFLLILAAAMYLIGYRHGYRDGEILNSGEGDEVIARRFKYDER
jgi:hypothetical protein